MRGLSQVLIGLFISGFVSGCLPGLPEVPKAHVTIQLVDENGNPVPQARVDVVGFHVFKEGRTDKQGLFVATVRNASGVVELQVRKEGFYSLYSQCYHFTAHTNGQWLPWNPIIRLRLNRVAKPVPMVVKEVDEYLPVLNEPAGYDLLIGDWVQPHGRGLTNDFIFVASRRLVDEWTHSGTLSLGFSGPADGLIRVVLPARDEYELRLPARAPEAGFTNSWLFVQQSARNPSNGLRDDYASFSEDDNYYFRVRSRTNESGEVRFALYGKIYWGIRFWVGTTNSNRRTGRTNSMPWVHFLYYLNPDGTRNTEFDTRSNLCPNPGTAGGRP
jgi:hypothetical protein